MNNAKSIRRALMNARPRKADGGEVDDGFKEALREGFGDRPLGLPPEIRQQMETPTPLGAINKGVINPAIAAGDLVLRGANAGVYGLAHGARKAYEALQPSLPQNWNESFGTGQQLENDIRDMPNAFMGNINEVPRNAAQTAVNIAKKPAGPMERGMINLGRDGEAAAAAASAPEPTYFSALERGIAAAKQAKASPQEWKAIVSKLPKEEVEWRGLDKFLDGQKGSVTRDQLLAHLNDNPVQVQDVWKTGDEAQKSRYVGYTLPGGENYKEMLLTLPPTPHKTNSVWKTIRQDGHVDSTWDSPDKALAQAERIGGTMRGDHQTADTSFRSSHFDEPNILAHVRMNDRTGPDGQKLLHVEEIQSDWHQKGKAQGYAPDPEKKAEAEKKIAELRDQGLKIGDQMDAVAASRDAVTNRITDERAWHDLASKRESLLNQIDEIKKSHSSAIPDAPFKDTKDWTGLAMKRVMRYAADNGYDGVTWTTGAQQADRYDLSKQVGEIHFDPHPRAAGKPISRGDLEVYDHDGKMIMNQESVSTDTLADLIGKDAAKRIIDEPTKRAGNYHILSGDGLRLGGHGMSDYYDKIVPSVANKLGKQYGAQVGKTKFGVHVDGNEMVRPGDRVTPVSGGYVVRRAGGENYGFWDDKDAAQQWLDKALRASEHATEVHHLPITPAMKGKAHKMFKRGGRVDHTPSEAQKEAGNYRKEHVRFQGLDISIENKKGSQRRGTDVSGKAWACTLPADYGYIKGTEGADGDHVDVYLGPDKSSPLVFVINQHDHRSGRFDEHKCMLAYTSERAAVADYCKAFSDGKGPDRLKSIEPMSMDAFKAWLKSGKTKKPATTRAIVDRALKLTSTLGSHRSATRHV